MRGEATGALGKYQGEGGICTGPGKMRKRPTGRGTKGKGNGRRHEMAWSSQKAMAAGYGSL